LPRGYRNILDKGITKEQSKALQGAAILMMLYHHLFSVPDALGTQYYSLLNIGGINIELRMAWFFKLCVGIYAFVSGYGLCRAIKRDKDSFIGSLRNGYICVFKKLFSFYKQYWLVFVIFVPIGFVFFNRQFVLSEFLLNLLGISSTYNGAWWYVYQYLKMLLIFPVMDCIFIWFKDRKERYYQWAFYAAVIAMLIALYVINRMAFTAFLEYFRPPLFLCFFAGYIISRFSLYELCCRFIPQKLLYFLGILGVVLVIAARVKIAKDATSVGLDYIFVPVFAFGFSVIMILLPKLKKFFCFYGGLSTYMWLTHVFFYDHYAKGLVMATHTSTGILLTLLVLSTAAAMALSYLANRIHK